MSIRCRELVFGVALFSLCFLAASVVLAERGESRGEPGVEPRRLERQGVVIEDIRVQVERAREKVLIHSNSPFDAKPFVMEGENPRLVIDIPNTLGLRKSFRSLEVGGAFIKDIRAHHHREKSTLRVVLDLRPDQNYRVYQTYFETQHIYMVEVEREE